MAEFDRRTFLLGSLAAAAAACRSGKSSAPTTTSPSTAASTTAAAANATATTTNVPTTAAAPVTTTMAPSASAPTFGFTENPFLLGVASGDPATDSVILWTKLDGAQLNQENVKPDPKLLWEVAPDKDFASIAASGTATAARDDIFTVHVDAKGLKPGTRYWYRFRVDTFTSAVGRTQTLPAAPTAPTSFRFGVGSCQDFQNGYYAAHRDIAASDLDAMVWLGDYIYEYGPDPSGVRQHTGGTCMTLADYQARYALYRSDANLQAAHASCPWLVIWDDHEVENNYAGDHSENEATSGVTPEAFAARRHLAYLAWWQFMPTRLPRPEPTGDYKIYRDLQVGSLAHIFLLDGRQYRSDQACGKPDDANFTFEQPCAEWSDETRTMLGATQERWLLDGIAASKTTWNIIGNQVVMGDARLNGAVLNYDQWDGYPAARQRLLSGISASGKRNVVVVTGDIHLAAVTDLVDGETIVASELVGTSISSGAILPEAIEGAVSAFPHLRYINARQRGWMLNEVSASSWKATYRVVSDVTKADSAIVSDAVFTIAPDKPGAIRV